MKTDFKVDSIAVVGTLIKKAIRNKIALSSLRNLISEERLKDLKGVINGDPFLAKRTLNELFDELRAIEEMLSSENDELFYEITTVRDIISGESDDIADILPDDLKWNWQ